MDHCYLRVHSEILKRHQKTKKQKVNRVCSSSICIMFKIGGSSHRELKKKLGKRIRSKSKLFNEQTNEVNYEYIELVQMVNELCFMIHIFTICLW